LKTLLPTIKVVSKGKVVTRQTTTSRASNEVAFSIRK
jgi:hypothetical protein